MKSISISVVMSVYNGEKAVARTIESILDQADVAFEFIIVNDGSTDQSLAIIESYAKRDERIKLSSHPNQGLTRSLITGCQQAQGEYIARQDCGDISLPGRLYTQLATLRENSDLSMLSCATEFVTPKGEHLYITRQSEDEARNGLKDLNVSQIKGPPHHGSVMFRATSYQQAGGYRKEFIVAQDIDLWTRLIEYGDHESLSKVLYRATVEKNSISSNQRALQFKTAEFIIASVKARANHLPQSLILRELERLNLASPSKVQNQRVLNSNYYYHLGSILMKTEPVAGKGYLLSAIKQNPFNWRALLKLALLLSKGD